MRYADGKEIELTCSQAPKNAWRKSESSIFSEAAEKNSVRQEGIFQP